MRAPNIFIKFIEGEIDADKIIDWILEVSGDAMNVSNIHIADMPTVEFTTTNLKIVSCG